MKPAPVFLLLLLTSFPSYAQTTGEKQVGQPGCKDGANAADFDTLAQCSSLNGTSGTFQKAPLFVGKVTAPPYTDTNCDSNKSGLIQYSTDTGFQGCQNNNWISLTGSGGNALYSVACTNAIAGGYMYCCQMLKSSGATTCKYASTPTGTWTTTPPPFSATTSGSYSVTMMIGASGINFQTVCRTNDNTGATVCVMANSWTSPTAWIQLTYNPF